MNLISQDSEYCNELILQGNHLFVSFDHVIELWNTKSNKKIKDFYQCTDTISCLVMFQSAMHCGILNSKNPLVTLNFIEMRVEHPLKSEFSLSVTAIKKFDNKSLLGIHYQGEDLSIRFMLSNRKEFAIVTQDPISEFTAFTFGNGALFAATKKHLRQSEEFALICWDFNPIREDV